MCAILGCTAQVCLLAAVLCGSPAIVCSFPMSTAGGNLLWVYEYVPVGSQYKSTRQYFRSCL